MATKKSSVLKSPVLYGHPLNNEILRGLPREETRIVFSLLSNVNLGLGEVLQEVGEPIRYGFFMNSGLASLLNVMEDGKSVEVGLCGKEGFVGLPLVVGWHTTPVRVIAQVAGDAFRIKATDFVKVLPQCRELERSLHRFGQEMGIQASQTAACNRLHAVEERLARWLLMSQDRLGGDLVPLTQEFLAHMLGTRRASVTVAAGVLQKAGLIKYARGNVNIVNRTKLEGASCECYQTLISQSEAWKRETNGRF